MSSTKVKGFLSYIKKSSIIRLLSSLSDMCDFVWNRTMIHLHSLICKSVKNYVIIILLQGMWFNEFPCLAPMTEAPLTAVIIIIEAGKCALRRIIIWEQGGPWFSILLVRIKTICLPKISITIFPLWIFHQIMTKYLITSYQKCFALAYLFHL